MDGGATSALSFRVNNWVAVAARPIDGDPDGTGADGYPTPTLSIGMEASRYVTRDARVPASFTIEMWRLPWFPGPVESTQDRSSRVSRPVLATT